MYFSCLYYDENIWKLSFEVWNLILVYKWLMCYNGCVYVYPCVRARERACVHVCVLVILRSICTNLMFTLIWLIHIFFHKTIFTVNDVFLQLRGTVDIAPNFFRWWAAYTKIEATLIIIINHFSCSAQIKGETNDGPCPLLHTYVRLRRESCSVWAD